MKLSLVAMVSLVVTTGWPQSERTLSPSGPTEPSGTAAVVLCSPDEPGEKLVFSGRVLDYRGQPLAKASVTAYHTDRNGLYNPQNSPTRVPRIRGVAITDEQGRFQFTSIKPAAYPNGTEPAHIHFAVFAPAHHYKYCDVWFEGDPLITEPKRAEAQRRKEPLIVRLVKRPDGAWTFSRDIQLEDS
jgi:protocatechuate 3,4-dioxygenase beta subunit